MLDLMKQEYDITENMSPSRNEERKKVKQMERELHNVEMNMLTPLNQEKKFRLTSAQVISLSWIQLTESIWNPSFSKKFGVNSF